MYQAAHGVKRDFYPDGIKAPSAGMASLPYEGEHGMRDHPVLFYTMDTLAKCGFHLHTKPSAEFDYAKLQLVYFKANENLQ